MESTFVLDSHITSCVRLPSDTSISSTLEKKCFLCNVKEIEKNCLVDSQESSLILCKVFDVPHLMNNLKKLQNINYCHPCKERILKIHESLDILKKLEREVLEEKYLIRLQLESNNKVIDNGLNYSSWDFGVQLVHEMRFKPIKSKFKKVVQNQFDDKFYSKAQNYKTMKNITITEELKHETLEGHISKQLTNPEINNIISTENQPFINNGGFVDSGTNSRLNHAELPLTSHAYEFDEIKFEVLSEETDNPIDMKDPFEGIVPESGFVTENSTVQKMFICGICETKFDDYNQLDEHGRIHHTLPKPFKCSYCEKPFSRRHMVKLHERIHTEERQFKCGYCDETFRDLNHMKAHGAIHRKVKLLKCKFCEKSFPCRQAVRKNERIHSEERPFSCGYCDKAFRYRNNRKSHEAIHNTVKPFNCKFCEKDFLRKSSMEIHERIHTGEKPFKCGYCDKTCRYGSSTKSHERIHTEEKPFKCRYCDKTFRDRSTMIVHEHIHKEEKPVKCGYCDKTFRHRKPMKSHERIHKVGKPF